MLVANYTNHNVRKIDMESRAIGIYAHEPAMLRTNPPRELSRRMAGAQLAALPIKNAPAHFVRQRQSRDAVENSQQSSSNLMIWSRTLAACS